MQTNAHAMSSSNQGMWCVAKLLAPVGLLLLLLTLGLAVAGPPSLVPPTVARFQDRKEEEEEDTKPTKPKKKIQLDEDDEKPTQGAPTPAPAAADFDFKRAAETAKHNGLYKLYKSLAVKHDVIYFIGTTNVTAGGNRVTGGPKDVDLLSKRVKDPKRDLRDKRLSYRLIDPGTGQPGKEDSIGPGGFDGVRYYEEIAFQGVRDFLTRKHHEKPRTSEDFLTLDAQLSAAEAILSNVLRFHESARSRGIRAGEDEDWSDLADNLRLTLLRDVQLARLEWLTAARSWGPGYALAKKLVESYTRNEDHQLIAGPTSRLLDASLKDTTLPPEKVQELRKQLEYFERRFPNSAVISPISKQLSAKAANLLDKARQELKRNNKDNAKRLARQAQEVWPEVAGLRKFLIEVDDEYRTLRVAMRSLPRYLSPGWATTDEEIRASQIQFESLMEVALDQQGARYYRPMLALGRPLVLPGGREFRLARNGVWSDGKRLQATDVLYTAKVLRGPEGKERPWRCKITGFSSTQGDLLERVTSVDSFTCRVYFQQGLIDPEGAISFPILPSPNGLRPNADKESFAERPVGSGPFVYEDRKSEGGRESMLFKANEHYGRLGREGLPRMNGVRFFSSDDPIKDLRESRIHLALDLTEEQFSQAREEGNLEAPWPERKAPDRRIWFLTLSNNSQALKNQNLRLALAHAINRKGLLDAHFRKVAEKDKAKLHQELTGPFPRGSWACPRDVDDKPLSDEALAKSKWLKAQQELSNKDVRLTLRYPTGDPRVKAALEALCQQVSKTLPGVTLTAEARTPYDLRGDVERSGAFDLAYYYYDYPDESYWILPVLQLSNPGSNTGKDLLVGQADKALAFRDFDKVRDETRVTHRQFVEAEMPFIPLWQLDSLYAYRKGSFGARWLDPGSGNIEFKPPTLEPRRVFAGIERWQVLQAQ